MVVAFALLVMVDPIQCFGVRSSVMSSMLRFSCQHVDGSTTINQINLFDYALTQMEMLIWFQIKGILYTSLIGIVLCLKTFILISNSSKWCKYMRTKCYPLGKWHWPALFSLEVLLPAFFVITWENLWCQYCQFCVFMKTSDTMHPDAQWIIQIQIHLHFDEDTNILLMNAATFIRSML